MTPQHGEQAFGCERCWPASAEEAWDAGLALDGALELVRESHFHVNIRLCRDCGQRFLWVFTETIDWDDSEDPQYWTRVPISAEEMSALEQAGESVEGRLESVAPERRSLRHDHPKETPAVSYWATGISVGPHD
ncbi:MAG TPA: hypothetical protein VEI06_10630 [Gemmatimonadaceae bacterium]|nr:hypothetical protein [Gemmatimonadaceae bacterium]